MMFTKLLKASFLLLLTTASVVSGATVTNPLRTSNGGDPDIQFYQGWYYFMSTNTANLQMTRATTLDGLKNGETKTVWSDTTASRCCNVWAPEMHLVGGKWYIYYTAGTSGTLNNQRSQVLAGGATPWDGYTFAGTINSPGWAIDGTVVNIGNKGYFVYSAFRSETGPSIQSLAIAEMTSPTTIGPEHLLSSPTQPWETVGNPVNEGPHALYNAGKTFLTFSASSCATPAYSLGLLTYVSGDPLNQASWRKSSGPVFVSANGLYGVGHNSFFRSPNGAETWITYHSTPDSNGNCGANRYTNSQKISFNANDGTPIFGQPNPEGRAYPGPAGE